MYDSLKHRLAVTLFGDRLDHVMHEFYNNLVLLTEDLLVFFENLDLAPLPCVDQPEGEGSRNESKNKGEHLA
jgi:hypothetical protein